MERLKPAKVGDCLPRLSSPETPIDPTFRIETRDISPPQDVTNMSLQEPISLFLSFSSSN